MKRSMFDLAALISRVTIGVIFVAHGWQKWQGGLGATTQAFAQSGVPLPQLAAGFASVAEIVGGVLLILGLFVRLSALVLLIVSLGALIFVHAPKGMFVQEGGWELVGSLAAICLLFLVLGGGRLGLDSLFGGLHRRRAARQVAAGETTGRTPPPTTGPTSTTGETTTGPPNVPRQPRGFRSSSDLSDQDMQDIDAIIDEPTKRRPPNR
ncbi:DoxX family protein [Nonomuraea sp. NPDC048916]|uniref:DoxX family protein n=1 Tax=Nonomuraea sp. NPDC048916 TaxID=3154232 RepID=UPI0033DB5DFA